MSLNIMKTSILLSIISIALAGRPTQYSATILNGFLAQIDTSPFEKVGDKLYYFSQEKLSWYNATLVCRELGGQLASLAEPAELADLSDHLASKYPLNQWWWLSGSDLQSEGKFAWYGTGKPFTFFDWSVNQPDNNGGLEHCVHLWYQQTKFQMNDWKCYEKAYYVCEAAKPKTVAVTVF